MTSLKVALLAVLVLGIGFMVLVQRLAGGGDASAQARAQAAFAPHPGIPSPAPAPPPAAAVAAAAVAPSPIAADVVNASPRNYPTDMAALLRAVRPLQREVDAGLETLDARGGCPLAGAFVQLTLETGGGEVLVREVALKRSPLGPADAPVADHDPAAEPVEVTDEPLLRCVREAMLEKSIHAPSAQPGRRWQVTYRRQAGPR